MQPQSPASPAQALAKLCRPHGSAPLPRPRLFARLDACAGRCVTWIAAPPGAGKTTLLSSWLAARGLRSLWFQLDADDADPATFFHYLGLALRQAGADAALDWPVLTPAYLPGLASFTRRCARHLAAVLPPPAVLVLDNHEQLPAECVLHGVLRDLAQALPPGLCLVVLGRGEPAEAFSRLQVHGDLVLLPAAELALSREEAEALVRAQADACDPGDPGDPGDPRRQGCPDPAQVAAEGWLDGLAPAVFERAPWLRCWRAAARLPFDPAAARGGYARAYAAFDAQDDAAGLYTAWAGVMESFFYEWRDFRGADPWIEEYARLRERHPDFPSPAVELRTYLAMGTLLHRRPQHPLLPAWSRRALALLETGAREAAVVLGGYLVIWTLWRGQTTEAQGIVERVEARARDGLPPLGAILWSCAVALLHSVRGELDACRARVRQAQAVARDNDLHAFDFLLAAQMARCSVIAGALDEAQDWLAAMARAVRDSPINTAFLRHLQSGAAAQQGEAPRALALAEAALEQAIEGGVPFLEAHCHLDQARLRLSQGDAAWAAALEAARRIGHGIGSPVVLNLCCELEAHAALARGDHAAARAALARALALSQAMDGATWLMGGPTASARLYDAALAAGVAVEHVRRLIRRRGLRPPAEARADEAWPWPVRVRLLGRFELLLDGVPLRSSPKPQHKPLELLQCLCACGGRSDTARLADTLWPEAEGDAADQALRTTLHRLRKLLGHDAALRLEDGQLALDAGLAWVDALAFERDARHAAAADAQSLRRALRRYGGPFLPGVSAPWALAGRERMRAAFVRLAERLAGLLQAADDWAGVAELSEQVLALEPLAEAFHCRLMEAYGRLGRRAEALAAYQHCRQLLLSHLGVSPAEATQALYRRLARE